MKKLNTLFVSLMAVMAFTMSAVAQKGIAQFEKVEHDFTTFKEEAGPQKYRFMFTNVGKADMKVNNVQASCGCTTPTWSKEVIKPGQKGYVEAEYNPAGRPGAFNKTITVFTDAEVPNIVLTIKGTVKEREKTVADLYPRKFGDIRLGSEYLNMGRVSPSTQKTEKFKVYNEGEKAVSLSFSNVPANLKITLNPAELKPKQTGEIVVDFDGTKKKDYGYSNDAIDLVAKGSSQENVKMYVVATIEDEPKKLTGDELAKAPRLKFEKKEHDFGTLKPGEVVAYDFKFTNTGQEKLLIHKTKASCGCTASEPTKKELAKEESSGIKVTFNSTGKHDGAQSQTVTVYSNDPTEPTQYITIKCTVDSKKKDESPMLAKPAAITSTTAPAEAVKAVKKAEVSAPSITDGKPAKVKKAVKDAKAAASAAAKGAK